jgi:protein disulfide-isomerase-like protein
MFSPGPSRGATRRRGVKATRVDMATPARGLATPAVGRRRASRRGRRAARRAARDDGATTGRRDARKTRDDDDDDGATARGGDGGGTRRGLARAIAGMVVMRAAATRARGFETARAASGDDGVVELTPENFEREVTRREGAVFVEFYAPWCPYCKRLEPIWEELPEKLEEAGSKTRVARMNVDAYADYASAYAVTGFPTLMLFENGRPVGAKTGLVDMTTAMKYAGVRDEGVLAKFAPEKKLDKILSGAQVEYVQGELGEVRKELGGIQDPASRARALEALQQVESIVGVRAL